MSRLFRIALLPVVATLTFTLSGCGDAAAPVAGTGATTLDGDWRLVSTSLDSVDPTLFETAPITLTVDGSDVTGRSACNSYFGTLETDAGALHFTGLGGTDMACEPDVMALETSYLQALALVDSAIRAQNMLTLTGAGVELTYEPVAAPTDQPFTGTRWALESLIAGPGPDGAVSSTAVTADIRFADDGTFSGSTGCGPVVGDWRLVDGQVETTFSDPPIPPGDNRPAPCFPDATAQLKQVMEVLSGPFTATISGDVLTLTGADGSGLGYRARPGDPADDPYGDPASDPAADSASGSGIDGTWLLQDGSLDGTAIAVGDAVITLTLEDDEGATTTGCATTAAVVRLAGSTLDVTLGPSTSPNCSAELRAIESAYISALGAATTYERGDDRLVLSGDGAELTFEAITPTKPS